MTAASDPIRYLASLFTGNGARGHLGGPVALTAHMLQAAALAESAGAPPALVAAALLHDAGHFTGLVTGHELRQGVDNQHAETGADWLGQWFGPEVTGPIRLHVAAKRYLCAVEPGYLSRLPASSAWTLRMQGGPMDTEQMAGFEADPQAGAALRLRRWDDAANDPGVSPSAFGYYQPLLRRLLRPGAGASRPRAAAPGRVSPQRF